MTGTSLDWADLEAGKIAGEDCSCFEYEHGTIECPYCHCHDDLAAALRAAFLRGRVAGMKEAVVFGQRASADDIEEYIRAAADKMEKGEA